jgi:hypothetical protein
MPENPIQIPGVLPSATQEVPSFNSITDPVDAWLTQSGVSFEVKEVEIPQEDGTVKKQLVRHITGQIPPVFNATMQFFADPDAPCYFRGCEELQIQFKDALNAAGGKECKACERGKIIRRMSPLVKKAIELELASQEENKVQSGQTDEHKEIPRIDPAPRPVKLSGSRAESPRRAKSWWGMLRSKAARIIQVLKDSE